MHTKVQFMDLQNGNNMCRTPWGYSKNKMSKGMKVFLRP